MSQGRSSSSERQKNRSIRWRLVPATFLYVIGGLAIFSSVFMTLGAIYINLRFGLIAPGSDNPARNAVSFTAANLTIWQLFFWIGVTSIYSARAWQKMRWRMAWIATFMVWLLMGVFRLYMS